MDVKPKSKKILVYIYNSFGDPLFQSNLFLYIRSAALTGDYHFVLITFEQQKFKLAEDDKRKVKEDLREINIHWQPLIWHTGKLKLLVKIYDLLVSLFVVLRYRLAGFRKIISLGTIAGSFAYLMSRFLLMEHFLYQYEPHSEFLRDCNIWSDRSLSFRILNRLEYLSGMKSKILATGTKHMIERLKDWKSPAKVFRIPSCVDENLFTFRAEDRKKLRTAMGIRERPVIIYVGKFGGIYYDYEMLQVFTAWYELNSDIHYVILTGEDHDNLRTQFGKAGIPEANYQILEVQHKDVPSYLAMADLGVVSVPPYPSQKFRSPIKVGEYLCCGLPYVVCKGVSEDDLYAEMYDVGVVMNEFSYDEAIRKWGVIERFLVNNKVSIRNQCRRVGIDYRGFSNLSSIMEQAFKLI